MSWGHVRCVVFDVDDTLYLERDYVYSGFRALEVWADTHLGTAGFAAQCWHLFEQGFRGDIFDRVLTNSRVGASAHVIDELVRRYRSHRPDIALLADARRCLDGLAGSVRLAAITDGPCESQQSKAQALGLSKWLDPILMTSELGPAFQKPSAAAFAQLSASLGCAGGACVYVADNPAKDFLAPASLSWHTVRVRRPGGQHYRAPSGADVELETDDLGDLLFLAKAPC